MNITDMSECSDADFPCPGDLESGYQERVAAGRRRMKDSSAVVAALARDVHDTLPDICTRIERLGAMFADYRVVLFENDSSDGTLGYLWAWQQENPAVTILTDQLGTARWPQVADPARGDQMAAYRNGYLRHAVERFAEFDYLIVLDTDLAGGFSREGVANTLGHDGWDMVGSYGIQVRPYAGRQDYPVFFDAWAYRDVGHPEAHDYGELNPRIYRRGQPLLPLWSCFGGLAVYRMEALRAGCRYEGGDCEHVMLHRRMRRRGFGRLFMNPSQMVWYTPRSPSHSATT